MYLSAISLCPLSASDCNIDLKLNVNHARVIIAYLFYTPHITEASQLTFAMPLSEGE